MKFYLQNQKHFNDIKYDKTYNIYDLFDFKNM